MNKKILIIGGVVLGAFISSCAPQPQVDVFVVTPKKKVVKKPVVKKPVDDAYNFNPVKQKN